LGRRSSNSGTDRRFERHTPLVDTDAERWAMCRVWVRAVETDGAFAERFSLRGMRCGVARSRAAARYLPNAG
jgi:hypothetical protein